MAIVIIGGVAAGLSAASRARRLAPGETITVLERGPAAGYGACGLPAFLGGRVPGLESLLAHPAEFFTTKRRLDLRLNTEALEIAPGRRAVRVRGPQGEAWLGYDRLVIATGASGAEAAKMPRPDLRNVFSANTWAQAQELDAALRAGGLRRGLVIGAGYIGLEIAEALRRRGCEVALAGRAPCPLPIVDAALAMRLEPALAAAGVEWHAATEVLELEGEPNGRVLGARTTQGRIAADFVVTCAGLRPHVGLATAAGVALGPTGAIAVDERQQTNLAGIYAAGDCAESRHLVTGAPVWTPLGAAANKQGRVAGQNASGHRVARFPGVLGTLAVEVFGLELGRTGLTLEQARAAGLDAAVVEVTSGSQAAYMSSQEVTLRMVFAPSTGRMLGCHFAGAPGTVAGRLNVAATCLAARMTIEQIEMLDLAYAPMLAPLYEPLLIAAHNAAGGQ